MTFRESRLILTYIDPDERFLSNAQREIIEVSRGHYLIEKNFEGDLNRGLVDTIIRSVTECKGLRPKRVEIIYDD